MKDNDQIAAINKQMNEMLENVVRINLRVENLMSIVSSLDKDVITSKHSITQELIDEGAFDVAKAYIDFLKARANRHDADRITVSSTDADRITVSSIGKKTMKKNNGADFGPDTKGTKTSGLQEAIDKAVEMGKAAGLGDEKDADKAPGE